MSILFAATYPERTWALVLEGGFTRERWAPDYPWGVRDDEYQADEASLQSWGAPDHSAGVAQALAPSADEENRQALARMIRLSASPGAAAALDQMNWEIDVRQVLPAIRVPTLVMNRTDESEFIVRGSRYLAENIAGARRVEIPGADHALFTADPEVVVGEIEGFLGRRGRSGPGKSRA